MQLPQAPEVLHEVRGLHWGTYAGSPADDRPTLALIQNLKTPANTVTSLSLTELLLMGPHTHLLTLRPDKGTPQPTIFDYPKPHNFPFQNVKSSSYSHMLCQNS